MSFLYLYELISAAFATRIGYIIWAYLVGIHHLFKVIASMLNSVSLFFFCLLTVTTVILRAKAQNARQFALRRRIPIVCQRNCVYTIIILSVDDLAGSKRSGGITTDDCYSESIPKGCCYSHPSCRATLEGL